MAFKPWPTLSFPSLFPYSTWRKLHCGWVRPKRWGLHLPQHLANNHYTSPGEAGHQHFSFFPILSWRSECSQEAEGSLPLTNSLLIEQRFYPRHDRPGIQVAQHYSNSRIEQRFHTERGKLRRKRSTALHNTQISDPEIFFPRGVAVHKKRVTELSTKELNLSKTKYLGKMKLRTLLK